MGLHQQVHVGADYPRVPSGHSPGLVMSPRRVRCWRRFAKPPYLHLAQRQGKVKLRDPATGTGLTAIVVSSHNALNKKSLLNLHANPLPDVSPSPCCNTPPPAHASTTLRSSRKSSQQQKKPQNQNWQMKVLPVLWSGLCCSPTGTGRVSPRRAGGSTAARGWSGERAPGTYHR